MNITISNFHQKCPIMTSLVFSPKLLLAQYFSKMKLLVWQSIWRYALAISCLQIKAILQYESPTYKSDTLRVKAVIVNPTKYWVYPRLKKWDYKNKKVEINPTEFSGNDNSNSRSGMTGPKFGHQTNRPRFAICNIRRSDRANISGDPCQVLINSNIERYHHHIAL